MENNKKSLNQDKTENIKGQKYVDDIPLEDLKIEQQEEKKKHKSKNASSSERKFAGKNDNE